MSFKPHICLYFPSSRFHSSRNTVVKNINIIEKIKVVTEVIIKAHFAYALMIALKMLIASPIHATHFILLVRKLVKQKY